MANRESDNLILLMAFALLANEAQPAIQSNTRGYGPFEFNESGDLVRGEKKENSISAILTLIQADNGRILKILTKIKDLLSDIHLLQEAEYSLNDPKSSLKLESLESIAALLGFEEITPFAPALEALMSLNTSLSKQEVDDSSSEFSFPIINPDGSKTRALLDSVTPTFKTKADEDEYKDLMELLDMFEDKED